MRFNDCSQDQHPKHGNFEKTSANTTLHSPSPLSELRSTTVSIEAAEDLWCSRSMVNCHQIGSLLPPEGRPPVYAQLCIIDSREALDHRLRRNNGLDPDLMYRLGGLISDNHRWAHVFKQADEAFQESNASQVTLQPTVNRNQERRQYSLPTSDEIAGVIPGDGAQTSCSRNVVLRRRNGSFRRVNQGSPVCEPLQYPLFFIYGEDGYHYELYMSPDKWKWLSRTDYTAYRIQKRENEFSLLLHGGHL